VTGGHKTGKARVGGNDFSGFHDIVILYTRCMLNGHILI
jgi:hypothetical protein